MHHYPDVEDLPSGGGYGLLRSSVVEAIAAGNLQDANPDLVSHYLWTSVHGLVTLAMACKLEAKDCPAAEAVPKSAVEMFRAFAPFLVNGLRGKNAGNGKAGGGIVWWSPQENGENSDAR